jgi:acyl-CoA thioester hydrolase
MGDGLILAHGDAAQTPARPHTASKAITPATGDIDRMGHVNNSVYLRWIEQAVHDDWEGLATPPEFASLLWVAVRHEIDYRRPAFRGDVLEISVRLDAVRRTRAWYETIIRRDDAVLVEGRSCWCCIDAETRQLTLIPRDTAKRILDAHATRLSIAKP